MPRPRDFTHSWRRDITVGVALGVGIVLAARLAWTIASWLL